MAISDNYKRGGPSKAGRLPIDLLQSNICRYFLMRKKIFTLVFTSFLIIFIVSIIHIFFPLKSMYENRRQFDNIRNLVNEEVLIPDMDIDPDLLDPFKETPGDSIFDKFAEIIKRLNDLKDYFRSLRDNPEYKEKSFYQKYKNLIEMNNDFVGWLTVKDTNIDYPVVQNTNEYMNFYLKHAVDKSWNELGSIYVYEKNNLKKDNCILILGHNYHHTGDMFGDLYNYILDSDYLYEHPDITFETVYGKEKYKACYVIAYKKFDKFNLLDNLNMNKEKFNDFVDLIENNSTYKTNDKIKYGDKILMLGTCQYIYDEAEMLVIAKKVN